MNFGKLSRTPFLQNTSSGVFISPFSAKPIFSTNEVFELLGMKINPFNQIIRKKPPKVVFVILLENYLGIALVYEVMSVWL